MKNISLTDARSTNPKKDENKKPTPTYIIIEVPRDRDDREKWFITANTVDGRLPTQDYGGERAPERHAQLAERNVDREFHTPWNCPSEMKANYRHA